MIEVTDLTKEFSGIKAVDNISFSIHPGEVTGFLGPNGAGKTTTLRMLTTYLAPTSGKISIFGEDPSENPIACKRAIGYLPESNPLYEDMEVCGFLKWCALMHGITGASAEKAVNNVIEKCQLQNAAGKFIGHLSKGYKQRVGLAKAIIHNPKILFMDEPTSGLDPNQAEDVRNLIKDLKKEKTIFLSTHILPEARSICDRVIIIHRGKIVIDGKIPEIVSGYEKEQKVILKLQQGNYEQVAERIKKLESVSKVEIAREEEAQLIIYSKSEQDIRPQIYKLCVSENIDILEIYKKSASFEEIFREITT